MDTTLEDIIKECECGVYLTVNSHKDYYMSVSDKIKEINDIDFGNNGHHENYEPEIDEPLTKRMIDENCIYELQFYPRTPIGFHRVYGTSLDEVIGKASEILF